MSRKYNVDEYINDTILVGDINVEVTLHRVGWYTDGDSLGYGEEPPDEDIAVVDFEINDAWVEEEGVDVEITDELKESVRKEIESLY